MDIESVIFGGAIGTVFGYAAHVLQTGYTESRTANRIRRALSREMADNFERCISQQAHHVWFRGFLGRDLNGMPFLMQPEYPLTAKDAASLATFASVAPVSKVYYEIGNDLHYLSKREVQEVERHYTGVRQIREATNPDEGVTIGKNEAFRFLHGVRSVLRSRETIQSFLHAAGSDDRFSTLDSIFSGTFTDAERRFIFE